MPKPTIYLGSRGRSHIFKASKFLNIGALQLVYVDFSSETQLLAWIFASDFKVTRGREWQGAGSAADRMGNA